MLTLHAADGTSHPLSSPTLAGLLDAAADLDVMGVGRLRGCYRLEGRAGELEALLEGGPLGLVLQGCCGRSQHEGEDLVHLGVRLAG